MTCTFLVDPVIIMLISGRCPTLQPHPLFSRDTLVKSQVLPGVPLIKERYVISSPNDMYLLSGSSDNNAYIWRVADPTALPVVLKGRLDAVTSVAWCPSDQGKVCLIPTSRAVCPEAPGQGCH